MNSRQATILNVLINEYIELGAPVSSSLIVDKAGLGVSSATVRNEMSALEESGYIIQPHTSAGRIPTPQAYRWYIDNLDDRLAAQNKSQDWQVMLTEIDAKLGNNSEQELKQVAKHVAKTTNLAIVWAFHRHNVYYTGIANLLSQPEFGQHNLISNISSIIDRLDDIVNEVFDDLPFEPQVLLGADSPFGHFSSAVITKYKSGDHTGLIGILGPVRMDYLKSLGIIKHLSQELSKK